jgi:hypothetical protein|tara:strand:- start:1417 stop:1689 length:273 start_codon:yes stop_codon:yes gene_type:complete
MNEFRMINGQMKTMVIEYQFDDPTMNTAVVNPCRTEREFVAKIAGDKDGSFAAVIANLGLTQIDITYEDWHIGHLFEGGTFDEPLRAKYW